MSSLHQPSFVVCGVDELPAQMGGRVTHAISILDPDYPRPTALRALPAARRLELSFHDQVAPRAAVALPGEAEVRRIIAFAHGAFAETGGAPGLLVHCYMGISRSTAAMITALVAAQRIDAREAFRTLRAIRPRSWPNSLMIHAADRLLDTGGALVEEMHRHQAHVARNHPEIADLIVEIGRGHEVAAALERPIP